MQTFLPYPSFVESAKCLDNKRLGKQRIEAFMILEINIGIRQNSGWRNHPAVIMWKDYEGWLYIYGLTICTEWKTCRRFQDTMFDKFVNISNNYILSTKVPHWFYNEAFHASHRSNLLRKDPKWYNQFGWTEPDNLPYVWPV